jgi:hypothetical protein
MTISIQFGMMQQETIFHIFSKNGLLALDDPKYENSPNKASMLITNIVDPYYNIGPRPQLFASAAVGILCRTTLFNPATVSSVVVHDPLPAGFSINNHGILAGYVESMEDEKAAYFISLTVTDLEGNSSDAELEIAITHINPELMPINVNETIPYELNANCTGIACGNNECDFRTCPTFVSCYCGKSCTCAQ